MAFLNSISLRNKVLLIVVLVLIGFVTVAVVAYQAMLTTSEREREIEEAYQIIDHTRQMEASLFMMESGERGFLITGDPTFLEKYENGQKRYNALFEELKNLLPAGSTEASLLADIDHELALWKTEAVQPLIDLRNAVVRGEAQLDQVVQGVASRVGRNRFLRVNDVLRLLADREYENLSRVLQASADARNALQTVLIGGPIVAILFESC